jgi:hypothetical protein
MSAWKINELLCGLHHLLEPARLQLATEASSRFELEPPRGLGHENWMTKTMVEKRGISEELLWF